MKTIKIKVNSILKHSGKTVEPDICPLLDVIPYTISYNCEYDTANPKQSTKSTLTITCTDSDHANIKKWIKDNNIEDMT